MKVFRFSILCTLLTICCVFTSSAQIHFGAKAGLTLASQSYKGFSSDFNPGILPGIMIGGVGEYDLTDNIRLAAGLQIGSKGYKGHDDGEDYKVGFTYMTIPVQAQYHRDEWMGAFGFYLGRALGVKYVEEDGDSATPDLGNDLSDDFSPGDFGIQLEAGYQVTTNIRGSLSYSMGVANIIPGEARKIFDNTIRNNVIGFNVTYFFDIE